MHRAIICHVSKYLLFAILILENHFVNWPEWLSIEMAWKEYGVTIKVSNLLMKFSFSLENIRMFILALIKT